MNRFVRLILRNISKISPSSKLCLNARFERKDRKRDEILRRRIGYFTPFETKLTSDSGWENLDNGTRALVNPPVLFKFCRERGNGAEMNVIARLLVYIRYYYYYYYHPFVPLKIVSRKIRD